MKNYNILAMLLHLLIPGKIKLVLNRSLYSKLLLVADGQLLWQVIAVKIAGYLRIWTKANNNCRSEVHKGTGALFTHCHNEPYRQKDHIEIS